MELPRTRRLIAALVLGVVSQLPALAEDSQPVEQATADKSTPDNGAGVRPVDPAAEPSTPKERPRLRDNEVISLARRLEVHGGMSFTYGWASGGRNFREAGAWVSYFDPVTGLGLAVGFSRFSGDMPYTYGYSPYGYYGFGGYTGWLRGGSGSTYDVDLSLFRPNFAIDVGFSQTQFSGRSGFDGSGSSLRRRY